MIDNNKLAEAILMFNLLPPINVVGKAEYYIVDKYGAKPVLIHQDDNEYGVMWVDEDFYAIVDFGADTPEKAIKMAYNWCVENNLISIN